MAGNPNSASDKSMEKLKQSGGYIIAVIALVLAGYFGWNYWQDNRTLGIDEEASKAYASLEVLTTAEELDEEAFAKQVSTLASEHPQSVYTWQALMQQAKLAIEADDLPQASDALKQAQEMKLEDAGLMALAQLRYASVLLAQNNLDEAYAVASKEMPASFEASQQELLGDIYMAQDKVNEAKRSYENAWSLLAKRQQERNILRLKLESFGVMPEPIEAKPSVINVPTALNIDNGGTEADDALSTSDMDNQAGENQVQTEIIEDSDVVSKTSE